MSSSSIRSEITRKNNRISTIEGELSKKREWLNNDKEKKRQYERRLDQVNQLIGTLSYAFDSDISNIQMNLTNAQQSIQSAISGDAAVYAEQVSTALADCKQDSTDSDSDLSEAGRYLSAEKKHCESKIEELRLEISNLEYQIEQLEQEKYRLHGEISVLQIQLQQAIREEEEEARRAAEARRREAESRRNSSRHTSRSRRYR